jgi:hypothetical protein
MAHLLAKLAQGDVFWMFTIAGMAVLTLCGIGLSVVMWGVPQGAGETLGVIVTLLAGQANSVINAIRSRWGQKAEDE